MATRDLDAVGCDASDLLVIHQVLRRGLADTSALVRSVPVGDVARAGRIADHIGIYATVLHSHHEGEDTLLWPDLETKRPGCAIHVALMKRHHAEIERHLVAMEAAIAVWRETAAADHARAVSDAADLLTATLAEHLGAEEREIIPVASAVLTQREWNRLGEHGRANSPKVPLALQLGAFVRSFPTEQGADAWLRANLPAPLRVVWRRILSKRYDAYVRDVYRDLVPAV